MNGCSMMTPQPCPLCHAENVAHFFADKFRDYLRCQTCHLIFVPTKFHLSLAAEKSEYDQHQNSPTDSGYRKFLSRLFEPLQQAVSQTGKLSHGLDFGSGPGPTLSAMFEEVGHIMRIYDPFYAPDKMALDTQYDFVTASEVVEHFRKPADNLDQLWSLVKPNGTLGVMTKLALDREAFSRWHYKNDPTHVAFYARETFQWLAQRWDAELEFFGKDVILIQRTR